MNTEPHFLNSLRQWHQPRSGSNARAPSRSSRSSADNSTPVTPLGSEFIRQHCSNASCTPLHFDTEKYWESVNLTKHAVRSIASRNSSENTCPKPIYKKTRSERSRSETITPATIRRILQQDLERMRLPIPKPFPGQQKSSNDTYIEGEAALPPCDEEFGGNPPRHPLKNCINDDVSPASSDTDDKTLLSVRSFAVHGSYSEPISHSATSPPRLTSSLRLRPKAHSHRGPVTLLKSLKSSPTPDFPHQLEEIQFDWSAQRLDKLYIRARLLEEQINDVNRASPVPDSGPGIVRPINLDMTTEEKALVTERKEAEQKQFIFKNLIWSHQSLVSAHPKHIVPYPLAYDKVNIQTDQHSYNLLKQLFFGQPSVHAGLHENPPTLVLDLGCGNGSWIIDTAQCWKNTQFYGLDLQRIHPSYSQLAAEIGEVANNIHFNHYNFLLDKLPYLDDKFDMVRMANLKWAIPEDMWDFLLAEVYRISKRGAYIEIIDDDFIIGSSPCGSCDRHLIGTSALEEQFTDMLQTRNLLLNPGSEFILGKLDKCRFKVSHEDVFRITIPPAGYIPMEAPSPVDAAPRKARLMGFPFDHGSRHNSVSSVMSNRSRSGSASSNASPYSSLGRTHTSSAQDHQPEERISSDSSRPCDHPLGVEVNSARFIPLPLSETIAHATRNMQSILACKEAMREYHSRKHPELEHLLIKEILHPEERQRFRELSALWNDTERAFDDAFWVFETIMLERLHLPQCSFDHFDDEEHCLQPPSPSPMSPRPHILRAVNSISQMRIGSIKTKTNNDEKYGHDGTSTLVRVIRVYGGWK